MAKITFQIYNSNGWWEDITLSKIKFKDEELMIGGSFKILVDNKEVFVHNASPSRKK